MRRTNERTNATVNVTVNVWRFRKNAIILIIRLQMRSSVFAPSLRQVLARVRALLFPPLRLFYDLYALYALPSVPLQLLAQ